jgi:hypothetical protein
VRTRAPGSIVQVRYDPFDLAELLIYEPDGSTRLESTSASKQTTTRAPSIPEESRASSPQISAQSVAYFTRLRERYLQSQKQSQEVSFRQLNRPDKEQSHG